MSLSAEKAQRLVTVAKLYYEQDLSQQQIATQMGISRPLVSRMLSEAKAEGIVHIEIRTPGQKRERLWQELRRKYGIRGGVCAPRAQHDNLTNHQLAEESIDFLLTQRARRIGIGWGTIIGEIVTALEDRPVMATGIESVCPLVGNSGVSTRNYHSDENARIVARQLSAAPQYLYVPAFAQTRQEQQVMQQLQYYKAVSEEWARLDLALVNIGNYPSVPDFACASRYGNMLVKGKAKGRLLAYYFNQEGQIFHSDTDYALQIPLELLQCCKNVVGVCSANTTPQALRGALATGLLHQVIATEELLDFMVDGAVT